MPPAASAQAEAKFELLVFITGSSHLRKDRAGARAEGNVPQQRHGPRQALSGV